MSCDGIPSRGKRAACASAAEKSRHRRHEPADGAAADVELPLSFGFEACRAARSGFEAAGTGGGTLAPSACAKEPGLTVGTGGVVFVSLLRPKESADFRGGGGSMICLRGGWSAIDCGVASSSTDSIRPGSVGVALTVGRAGGGGVVPICFGCTLGVDFIDFSWNLLFEGVLLLYFLKFASFSSCVLLGGRAGRLDGS
jgi:hypothetical protein